MPKCRNCNGSGKAHRTLPGFTRSWRDTCRKCDGAGYRIDWAGWAINSMPAPTPAVRELTPEERREAFFADLQMLSRAALAAVDRPIFKITDLNPAEVGWATLAPAGPDAPPRVGVAEVRTAEAGGHVQGMSQGGAREK